MTSAFAGEPTSYRVILQITSTSNFTEGKCKATLGEPKGCYWIDVTEKTATAFKIQLRQMENGNLVNASKEITFDYIAMPNN